MSQLRHKPGKFLNPQYIKVDKLTQRVSQIVGSNRFAKKYHAAHVLAHAAIQYTQLVYQGLKNGEIIRKIRELGITSTEVNGEKERGINSEAVLAICADIVTNLLKSQHKSEREEVQYGQGNFYS